MWREWKKSAKFWAVRRRGGPAEAGSRGAPNLGRTHENLGRTLEHRHTTPQHTPQHTPPHNTTTQRNNNTTVGPAQGGLGVGGFVERCWAAQGGPWPKKQDMSNKFRRAAHWPRFFGCQVRKGLGTKRFDQKKWSGPKVVRAKSGAGQKWYGPKVVWAKSGHCHLNRVRKRRAAGAWEPTLMIKILKIPQDYQ